MNTRIKKGRTPSGDKATPTFPVDEQFSLMADAVPVLLWVSGASHHDFFLNKAWEKYTGKKFSQESGQDLMKVIHPDDQENYKRIYREAFDKQKGFKTEYRLRRYNGSYRWVLDKGVPNFSKEKKFRGFIGSCMDIHELKEMEHKKDQFMIAASHELKTPLTTLNIYLHLIEGFFNKDTDKKCKAYVKGASAQASKINELINQLLDLSRVQKDSLRLNYTVFSFGALVKEEVEKMRILFPSHKIILKGKATSVIKGDTERLSQALENLLANASKYSNENDEIIVELAEDTKKVQVSVIDFGIGIAKEHLPRIFDRFYRISGVKEETFPGLGIGLYISRLIMKKHGGRISVQSVVNKKTKFTLQVPVYKKTG